MKRILAAIILAALALACTPTEDVKPGPKLVSTNPADGTTGIITSSLSVVFTFDRYIKCTTSSQKKVTIDGGASVGNVVAYGKDLTVDVSGLKRGQSYTLNIPEGIVESYKSGEGGSAAITYHFATKEAGSSTDVPEGWESAAQCVVNMGVGWNLGNTLESNSGDVDNMWIEMGQRRTSDYETAWGQPLATRELIHMFKEAGFGAIRVPVTWYPHMGTVTVVGRHWDMSTWTGYAVDSKWMDRVEEVVNYVLDEGMYCILNVHHDTGTATTAWLRADKTVFNSVKDRYIDLWTQIATRFIGYDQKLVFESFNEMLDNNGTWNYSTSDSHEAINMYNAAFVETVRATGGNNAVRNLILNTYAASPQPQALKDFKLPADTVEGHLMAEVHSYAPYNFAFDTSNPQNVFDSNCEKEVKSIVENMNTYLVKKGIPCVLGEFGADTAKREESELAKQAACYVSAATKYNIPCFYWMGLSDGQDRAVPQWTKPAVKNAILNAYASSK